MALLCGDMGAKEESCRGEAGLVLAVCAFGETGVLAVGDELVLLGIMIEGRGCSEGRGGT